MIVKTHVLSDRYLKYVVIFSYYKNEWLMVRYKERSTYEVPGGHIEAGESPDEAAKRELYEETGALSFKMTPICDYSVSRSDDPSYGRLYIAVIDQLGDLLESEIVEVKALDDSMVWTYEAIQPILFDCIHNYLKTKKA